MTSNYIKRTLWFQHQDGREMVAQDELLKNNEPQVVLGEAGMGKSELLAQLSEADGYTFCTANQLIKRANPKSLLANAQTLVIDSLDEVSTQKPGDAVDLVLKKLGELDYPNFILSCRVADWRSATGAEAIKEQYLFYPLEFHLEPFTDEESILFLSSIIGEDRATQVIKHFNQRGLKGLLSNPQTLNLIKDVVNKGSLPETRSELFERATEILWVEHNEKKIENLLTRQIALDAAGVAFASLILTGNEAIVRKTPVSVCEGELRLADVSLLPAGIFLKDVLDSRLFKSLGADKFGYLHRSIGEYLGARWLVKQAVTRLQRKRLLKLFSSNGLVPPNLRGLHAWLAQAPELAKNVIQSDPMGFIEYGDADNLSSEQGKALLEALELLAAENPHFRSWNSYSVRGLVQPELILKLRKLIIDKNTPYSLRALLLDSVKGTHFAIEFMSEMKNIILDVDDSYACRSAAGEALVDIISDIEWPRIMISLSRFNDDLSIRLAIELLGEVGFDKFSNEMIADLARSYTKKEGYVVGVLYVLERQLPDARLVGVLDCVTLILRNKLKGVDHEGIVTFTGFAYYLISRVMILENETIDVIKLWSWLEPLNGLRVSNVDSQKNIWDIFKANENLRRSLYKLVILECDTGESIWRRMCRLNESLPNSWPIIQDIAYLLHFLDPNDYLDTRWKELVEVSCHQAPITDEVYNAAIPFTIQRPELQSWLEEKRICVIPEWKIKNDEMLRDKNEKIAIEYEKSRGYYYENISAIQDGKYEFIVDPAMAYLGVLSGVDVSLVVVPERISKWLGQELQSAVFCGFNEFLKIKNPSPNASDIAEHLAKDSYYYSSYILVAALAEKHRECEGFKYISDERLIAGMLMLRRSKVHVDAGIGGLENAIRECLIERGEWESTMRLYYEPLLAAGRYPINDLGLLLGDKSQSTLALKLSLEWLNRFTNLPAEVEAKLTDTLIFNSKFDLLRELAIDRVMHVENVERHLNWTAILLITDFDKTRNRLDEFPINPDLIWHIRDCCRSENLAKSFQLLHIEFIKWIIQTFRSCWPFVDQWKNIPSGGRNDYSASDFMNSLLKRLANDISLPGCLALRYLRESSHDSYTQILRELVLEQAKLRSEAIYTPHSLEEINAITSDYLPVTAVDLQTVILDELALVQAKIKSDDVESWRGFYGDHMNPFNEERCRDHLLGLLRQSCNGITLEPESHIAADKEVDITCSAAKLRLPIEVKGQWHPDLWLASDIQLDRLYAQDWKAENYGIYLVLWFGKHGKPLASPGRNVKRPQTPDELRFMLIQRSQAAQEGRVAIFVLDVEHS